MPAVKKPSAKAERARATRRRIVQAAGDLFLAQGYGATQLQEIADHAGVAVQTIYFAFGNKRTVLKELVDVTIQGDDEPVPTMERTWFREMLGAPTAADQLRLHVTGTRPILERVAPIVRVVDAAAAADPEVAVLWPDEVDPRLTVLEHAADALLAKPDVRHGLEPAEAIDVMFGLLSPELFLVMTAQRGWAPSQWQTWTYDLLAAQLLSGRRGASRDS